MGSVVFSNGEINSQELTHTLSQEELMDVLWDLLIAKSNTPKMAVLIRDKIGDISPGSSSHRAGVLKVALKNAFEKKKEQYPGVRLACPNQRCAWYGARASRSEIGTDLTCQLCFNRGDEPAYFVCASCRFGGTGDYVWCLVCGKWFE